MTRDQGAMSDHQRVEPRWKCIKEGEVSPYKLVLCLFIRENFMVNPPPPQLVLNPVGSGDDAAAPKPPIVEKNLSPRTLILIYRLITSVDIPFTKFKALIDDASAQVRPEVLRKFMKIISNLEDGNVGFLYELFHSVIVVDFNKSTQVTHVSVLKKKVEKNSPFGRFLRMVLMNVRRMSYPQVHYLYRQLCSYVGDFVKLRKKSVGIIPPEQVPKTPNTPTSVREKEDTAGPPTSTPVPLGVLSEIPTTSGTSKSCKSVLKLAQQPNPYKFRGLEIFQRMSDRSRRGGQAALGLDLFMQYTAEYKRATGKWNLAQERDLQKHVEDKKRRAASALEATKSLRNLWQANPLLRTASQASLDSGGDPEFSGPGVRHVSKRRSGGRPTPIPTRTLPSRSPRKSRGPILIPQELNPLCEHDDGFFPSDDDDTMGPPSATTITPRSKSKGKIRTSKKSPSSNVSRSFDNSIATTPEAKNAVGDRCFKEVPASHKWDQVKSWSRKQIERALRQLAVELMNTSYYSYSPKDISAFVQIITQNPSAQILLSQIYFIEYLNCMRMKDIRRCSEALRTSFDIRIKPNTSELNKAVPYASYNFAVFYQFMGYKKDTLLCLEEAFRAGHSAADATCLHYCHNMWSSLQNKPYTDAIVTVTKEVDNNMAYLHSLNVISNAFDYHYQRQPPEEVLYTLWHYNAECDLEEMESLLLLSLGGFFMSFGWHEMVSFPCQIILYSKLKWPLKAYCKALCILADSLLIRGETDIPCAIMDYGESFFGYDASDVGQMFCLRHATFKAFHAYLGYRPVPDSVIATLHSYNKIEGFYWQAYSRMVGNEWEQASNLLTSLSKLLKEDEISCENNDMKIRCLLLMAELQCLSAAPASALGYIYEALEIAYSFSADHHVTLCLSHIASIQCELGLPTAASKTIHKEMRSVVRSSNPWLNVRLNVITAKISLRLHETIPKLCEQQLMKKLTSSEELYKKWDNAYRLKEVYHLKAQLLDKSEDLQLNGNAYRKLLESMESHLIWSPSTCLL